MIKRREIKPIVQGDKRVIRGWVMYDWANSVYQLTISSAVFPIYYNAVTRNGDNFTVDFFGLPVINTVLFSWTIAASYLIMAIFSPLLSSMADYTGRRKTFMKVFTWIGALSCGLLFFFDRSTIELGIIAFGLATIGYGGSIVFYNSFLPVIAKPEDQDRISARGYSMGYIGSVILLIINLVVILKHDWFGFGADSAMPAKLAFLSVFLWWIGFSQITFRMLPKYTFGRRQKNVRIFTQGYRDIKKVSRNVWRTKSFRIYLIGFFFVMTGILTTMAMAVTYAEKHLGLDDSVLIPTVLMIQLIGVAGAMFFAKLSGWIGNFKSLIIVVLIWICIIIGAYYIQNAGSFVIAAVFIGFVMGGSQSLARSTYSKMLPETTDHTSYFSFYDVMEKMAMVFGTFSFGIIEAITGNMRNSVLAIGIFFFFGFLFLSSMVVRESRKSAD
jgi:UMF1 family MFS transporter